MLCVNYVGVQSQVPPQRGGTGPWEALEMWLWPSCALEPSLPLTLWPLDGFAGRGDGAQDLRRTCPWQLGREEVAVCV